ncbi:hypothetical protein Gogos_005529 [Gossypium gossypioides]|uniref:Uncharacterized protein n=1 Tax=Gossypium gossypioides TaxID=34282 RepID=A0A7J9CY11_GOSGO|nr:hypothetical protein [Gossypium gossypioides]
MRRIWRGTFLLVDFNLLREKGIWQHMQWLLKVCESMRIRSGLNTCQ